jgi:hypothetical protein
MSINWQIAESAKSVKYFFNSCISLRFIPNPLVNKCTGRSSDLLPSSGAFPFRNRNSGGMPELLTELTAAETVQVFHLIPSFYEHRMMYVNQCVVKVVIN